MLPKIIVTKFVERKDIYGGIGLVENKLMGYEGGDAKVDDLRIWILAAIDIARRDPSLKIVIWDADKLSPECQAILLKPLEELSESIHLYLIVSNEYKLLPTIISRVLVEYVGEKDSDEPLYWTEVRKCFASGPAACIAFSDSLDKDQAKVMIVEVIIKLKASLVTEINSKRLLVIENALKCLTELEGTNINQKLSVDNFLISSWGLIKS